MLGETSVVSDELIWRAKATSHFGKIVLTA